MMTTHSARTVRTTRINLDPSEQFVLTKRYGSRRFRVDTVRLEVTEDDRVLTGVKIHATGLRVLKSGLPSRERVGDAWYPGGLYGAHEIAPEVLAVIERAGLRLPELAPRS